MLNNAFYGKTIEIFCNRCKREFIIKDYVEKLIKQQSKLTFNGIHKSNTKHDSYTFKQNEVLMDKPIHLGYAEVALSKLHIIETYYDKLQPYFGHDKLELHYMDCHSFVLSFETQNIMNDLKKFVYLFDFSILDGIYEIFSNHNKKLCW